MADIILGLLAPLAIIAAIAAFLIRRGLQMHRLCAKGVAVTGQVIGKRSVRGGATISRRQKLVYRYRDAAGASHEHTSVVPWEVYERYDDGDAIEVVYLPASPAVSAPRYLVDQSRKALGKSS